MTTSRLLLTLLAGVLTMGASPRTSAEEAPAAKAQPQAAAEARAERKAPARAKRVLRLEELKVEGRIQKPQAMFLMPRANLNYVDLDRGESFVPRVGEALEREPF